MPFYYAIKVPKLPAGGKYPFVRWAPSGKSHIEANNAPAIVRGGETRNGLRNAGAGFSTLGKDQTGEEIFPGRQSAGSLPAGN
jgi:hypothetical protein